MSKYHKNLTPEQINLMEKLASIEHTRWADWQAYIMSESFKVVSRDDKVIHLTIPTEYWENWNKQIRTYYKYLSEKEKDSDREQVMRYWELIKS